MNDWINTLKPGDTIVAFSRRCEVVRLTASQVVFTFRDKEYRARRKDGYVVGHATGLHARRIREATPAALAKLDALARRYWATHKLPSLVRKMSDEQVKQLHDLVVPWGVTL